MNQHNNPFLTELSKELRKNMTPEERHLWYDFLKTLPNTFQRQKVFDRYILDFYCAEKKLAIEIDGSQHFEDASMQYDAERTQYLNQYGIHVIRFTNREIKTNFRGVCEEIRKHLI